MRDIQHIDEIQWINRYFEATDLLEYRHLKPVLCFPLIWNIFETYACGCEANPCSILSAISRAQHLGRLSDDRYDIYLKFFREKYLTNGQTLEIFFDVLLLQNPDYQAVVRRAFNCKVSSLSDRVYALLLVAYRIRNNLFHGNKAVRELPQQMELFIAVNALLITFIEDIKRPVS